MLVCAFLCATCTRDRGCSAHPAFPAPSSSRGTTSCAKLGQSVSREHGFLSVSGEALIKLNPAPPCHCEEHSCPPKPASGEGGCETTASAEALRAKAEAIHS